MTTYKTLLTERADKILTVTLNRPEKLNALSATLLAELRALFAEVAYDPEVSVVVIKASGKAFTVGYDLNESEWLISQYPANYDGKVDLDRDRQDILGLVDHWVQLWKFPKPIIAQVQGLCLSGGGELLAICDMVVAGEDAQFGHPAGRDLGIPPTVFMWPMLIGMRKTRELLYTAKLIGAVEAERLGLVNQVSPREALDQQTRELALDVAKTPSNHLAILKSATNRFYENMGMFASWQSGAELDAIFHQSPAYIAFFKLVKEQGMRAALDNRRKLYG
ncbi:enoyl-CoA hydratase/isomerase family protein [Stenotrophobium rhamnosiphilum]|uniref:Enoyl-CoA hydratase/isomerase family protein n=1 Tax=Stenotrophobium rhamnosiphilum TaxID=2029166 RepID=A0A2T5MH27_9GAMM|nr:enoyl-CoA hydratase-related protein [Stenotrophobium rhamnosiphilum]PTU31863.1 enoyl-CoA hydratase/isomerase family protein [Stenotrophobium rhamnosiphilum]